MITTTITVKTSYEGVHCFPGAPDEVAYLRVPHRHIFNVGVEVEVFHNDRELEFIMLKHRINQWLQERFDSNGVWQMEHLSCEQVASKLAHYVHELAPDPTGTYVRYIRVSVDEDGENGASVSFGGAC